MDLENCENAFSTSKIVIMTDDEEEVRQIYTPTKAVILLILFNLCLICACIPLYIYMNSTSDTVRHRTLDWVLSGGSVFMIFLLYRMGDLSKDRPNFYYI